MRLTVAQLKAARALLGWTVADLAEHSGVGASTIRRFEGSSNETGMIPANVAAIRAALEEAGVDLLDATDDAGFGARLRRP